MIPPQSVIRRNNTQRSALQPPPTNGQNRGSHRSDGCDPASASVNDGGVNHRSSSSSSRPVTTGKGAPTLPLADRRSHRSSGGGAATAGFGDDSAKKRAPTKGNGVPLQPQPTNYYDTGSHRSGGGGAGGGGGDNRASTCCSGKQR